MNTQSHQVTSAKPANAFALSGLINSHVIIGVFATLCVAIMMSAMIVTAQVSREHTSYYQAALDYCMEHNCAAESLAAETSTSYNQDAYEKYTGTEETTLEASVNVIE